MKLNQKDIALFVGGLFFACFMCVGSPVSASEGVKQGKTTTLNGLPCCDCTELSATECFCAV